MTERSSFLVRFRVRGGQCVDRSAGRLFRKQQPTGAGVAGAGVGTGGCQVSVSGPSAEVAAEWLPGAVHRGQSSREQGAESGVGRGGEVGCMVWVEGRGHEGGGRGNGVIFRQASGHRRRAGWKCLDARHTTSGTEEGDPGRDRVRSRAAGWALGAPGGRERPRRGARPRERQKRSPSRQPGGRGGRGPPSRRPAWPR